jgi:hypothetical protein
LSELSLNAPWNCVTNRLQKPRSEVFGSDSRETPEFDFVVMILKAAFYARLNPHINSDYGQSLARPFL